ncbi:MAG: ATP-binding cassette domain-containing protein [Bacteroidota bacterium]
MITVQNLSLRFGKRTLFEDVNLKFTPGNCYGIIGANGAGKSTFLKILSGEIDPNTGSVSIGADMRMSVLKQDHFEFNEIPVLQTVIMGNKKLWELKEAIDAIYAKPDFSDEDGLKAAEMSGEYEDMDGWNAEADAAELLSNLGIPESLHYATMREINGNQKVRVLLAQALFGNPDILLLDEPTNDLDVETISWLEDFLADYKNIVIVVSHDRHFLDAVCTNIVDIDFGKISMHTGNYSFWYEASQLLLKQRAEKNKKIEDKRKELQSFIERFSANASKSRQATSRKKLLSKLSLEDMKPSSRKYPGIIFKQEREAGKQVLEVHNLSKTLEGRTLFSNVTLEIMKGDKVAIFSRDSLATTALFEIIMGNMEADSGDYKWGVTIKPAYLPLNNSAFFTDKELNLIEWLRQFSENKEEAFVRGYLGKMLFTGEETLKNCTVLSGGEKMRCMIARMMLQEPNFLIMDEPTNHLDLESITAFNNNLIDYPGTVMVNSHDHQFMDTVATRVIEITPTGVLDKLMDFDEYVSRDDLKEVRDKMYLVTA